MRRGGEWWIQWERDGVLAEEPTGTADLDEAVAIFKRGESGTRGESMFEDLERVLVQDCILNERRGTERVKAALRALRVRFGKSLLREINTKEMLAYVAERLKCCARGTVKYELSILRRGMGLMVDMEQLRVLPKFPKLRGSPPRKGWLEVEQLEEILRHLAPVYVPAIRFLSMTGWRLREALGLRWEQVDFKCGIVRVEETKNRHPREFPFNAYPPLETLLKDQRARVSLVERARRAVCPWVFPSRSGRQIKQVWFAWGDARTKAGYPAALIHDLRRTVVRRLERAGVPRRIAMAITGHKTESVYARYDIVDERDLAEGVRKLWRHDSGNAV